MKVDKRLILSLIASAMSADYTRVRRIGSEIAHLFAQQKDVETAKEIQTLLRKRGVPLQASGHIESLPRDSASRLPLVEEGQWPTTPIMLGKADGRTVSQFIDDAKHIELLSKNGVSARLGLLIFGPPGTGKSLLAGHIAASLKRPIYIVRLDSLISSRLGETAKNVRGIFDFIPTKSAVLFLDEMDAIAKLRDDRNELGELKRVVNTVIQGLDSMANDIVTIGATNHPHLLDPAIWRRFPYKVELGAPDLDVRNSLWLHFLFQEDAARSRDAELLSLVSEGLTGADIENIALGARRLKIISKKEPSLAQVILAIHSLKSRNPRLVDISEISTNEKRTLALLLEDSGKISQSEIARIVGVSRQMVHRYLKEAPDG